MVYEERNTWAGLITSVIAVTVYIILVLVQADGGPLTAVDWVPLMLWTIGAGIVGTVILSIVWGILAGRSDPDGIGKRDQRDRDISAMSSRVGQAFTVIAGLGVIVLCAFRADWFWIAHCMFLGFAATSIVGGIAALIAYRRGLA